MKLVYKGVCKKMKNLPKVVLPEKAVKFKEPNSFGVILLIAIAFVVAIYVVFHFISIAVNPQIINLYDYIARGWIGWVIAIVICMPLLTLSYFLVIKDSEINYYFIPLYLLIAYDYNKPISKRKFMILTIFPTLVSVVIPYIVWLFIPDAGIISNIILAFVYCSILIYSPCLTNVLNTIFYMPKGSFQILSGGNSYWVRKEDMEGYIPCVPLVESEETPVA